MPRNEKYTLALVTAPDVKTARRLAQLVLKARLAACVNLVPRIESRYWWRGKLEKAAEVLMVIKTTARKLAPLERLIVQEHPYDTPEFIVLPIAGGNRRYLDWLSGAISSAEGSPSERVVWTKNAYG